MLNWLFGDRPIQEVIMRDPNATETLIWQHPSTEFNTHSRVNLGLNEIAVFYDMFNGNIEIIDQSKDLTTGNIPILSRIPTAITGGVSKYQCRVYFIRTSPSKQLPWGTPNLLGPFPDGIHKGMVYSFRMNGIYSFQVGDVNKLLQLVDSDRAIDFNTFEEERVFGSLVSKMNKLINQVALTIGLDFMLTREFFLNCSEALAADLQNSVLDDMGIKLKQFEINEVLLPDDPNDPYVRALASMTEEATMVAGLGIQGIQNYMTTHSISIATIAANNNGGAGAATGIGIGAGVGMGVGGQLGNMMQDVFGRFTTPPVNPTPNPIPGPTDPIGVGMGILNPNPTPNPTNPFTPAIEERISKLKGLLDKKIISQEQFDSRVNEILKSEGL